MDLSGRVGAFQCKLRRGRRAAKSSCINEKTPDGSWYSTKMSQYYNLGVARVHTSIPVTFELDSPSITVGSAAVCLEPCSATPRAGAPSPAKLMKRVHPIYAV